MNSTNAESPTTPEPQNSYSFSESAELLCPVKPLAEMTDEELMAAIQERQRVRTSAPTLRSALGVEGKRKTSTAKSEAGLKDLLDEIL